MLHCLAPQDTSYTRPLLTRPADITDVIERKKNHKVRRQTNLFQMKEQDKTSQIELNKTKASNLPDKEFKVMVVKMLSEL